MKLHLSKSLKRFLCVCSQMTVYEFYVYARYRIEMNGSGTSFQITSVFVNRIGLICVDGILCRKIYFAFDCGKILAQHSPYKTYTVHTVNSNQCYTEWCPINIFTFIMINAPWLFSICLKCQETSSLDFGMGMFLNS